MHGVFQLGSGGAFGEIEFFVQSVEAEVVTVGAARGARTNVFRRAGVIESDDGAGRDGILFDHRGSRLDVPDQPVVPRPHGNIGVVDNENETLGLGRDAADGERRIDVLSVRSETARNRMRVAESFGRDLHRVTTRCLLSCCGARSHEAIVPARHCIWLTLGGNALPGYGVFCREKVVGGKPGATARPPQVCLNPFGDRPMVRI